MLEAIRQGIVGNISKVDSRSGSIFEVLNNIFLLLDV